MPAKVCGQFSIENEILSGPKEYMEDQGNMLVDKIFADEDTVFNMTAHLSPDVETAIVVRLQTDYAGWLGMRQVESWLKNDREPR